MSAEYRLSHSGKVHRSDCVYAQDVLQTVTSEGLYSSRRAYSRCMHCAPDVSQYRYMPTKATDRLGVDDIGRDTDFGAVKSVLHEEFSTTVTFDGGRQILFPKGKSISFIPRVSVQ